jgi:hypothetical protein
MQRIQFKALVEKSGHTLPVGPLREAWEKAKAEKLQEVATATVGFFGDAEKAMVREAKESREYNRLAAEARKRGERIELALEYAINTGNVLPLAKALGRTATVTNTLERAGIELPSDDDAAWTVPAGWEPEAKPTET